MSKIGKWQHGWRQWQIGWQIGWLLSVVSILVLSGCAATAVATPRPVLITIAGATSLQPVLQELTVEFNRQHPNVLFTLRGGGSTLGEEQAFAGLVDLGASTLFAPDNAAGNIGLVRIPIGVDGLAIIVHSSNPIADLSLEQLRQLYSGDILDWESVGSDMGTSEEISEIILVSREDGSGARRLFESEVMGDVAVSLTAVVMPTSGDVVDYVAKTPNAVGYVSRGWVMATSAPSAPAASSAIAGPSTAGPIAAATPELRVRAVPLEGQLPTLENIRTQRYALNQPLYLISRGQTRGWVRQFVDYVLSPAGQNVVRRYHLPVR